MLPAALGESPRGEIEQKLHKASGAQMLFISRSIQFKNVHQQQNNMHIWCSKVRLMYTKWATASMEHVANADTKSDVASTKNVRTQNYKVCIMHFIQGADVLFKACR